MNRTALGKRIREERLRSGFTQEQLAEHINVTTTYVGLIERGDRSVTLEKLILIANCLHVSIDELLQEFLPNLTSSSLDKQMHLTWNSASDTDKELILTLSKAIVQHSKK